MVWIKKLFEFQNVGSIEDDFEKTLQQLDEQSCHRKEIKGNSKRHSAVDHNSKSSESFKKTLKQLDEQESFQQKEVQSSPKHHSAVDPKPKPNENSPPEKKPSKEIPVKETSSSKLSSKLKRFEFGKRGHDIHTDLSGSCQDERNELQHKDKKVKLESHEKEKISRDKRGSPNKKESLQKDIRTKSEQVKSIKDEKSETDSKKVSGQSSKEEETSLKEEKKGVKVKEKPSTSEKKVTPKKPAKQDTQAPDTTPQDEKKKAARNSYLKFLHRSGPANPGSKSIPEVKLCFSLYKFIKNKSGI